MKSTIDQELIIYKIRNNILIIVKVTKDIRKLTLAKNFCKYFSCEGK
jgi:hypothetical protein